MINRISINGRDVSNAIEEGMVISQANRTNWRVTLQLGSQERAIEASGLLKEQVGSTVEVEVHESRGTVLKGAAVVSRFDPLTRYSELTGASAFTRERARPNTSS
jgi:hypothetical protein